MAATVLTDSGSISSVYSEYSAPKRPRFEEEPSSSTSFEVQGPTLEEILGGPKSVPSRLMEGVSWGPFSSAMTDLIASLLAEPEPTQASLRMQLIAIQRLLLSHPDPLSFRRAALTRRQSEEALAELDLDSLKALYEERLMQLYSLYSRAVRASIEGDVFGDDPAWDELLDAVGELDAVVWAYVEALRGNSGGPDQS
ncbi:hypothetical protein CSUI_010058 [Cystoisospora suis]|uniref:Uncharacterized protein n=1 Tax=Cystoisospora suis TaxID=483139 RepID=A0A2C6KG79_9APIC|nr:hypothetical protein CSUI_010058 [Cystoisospora suis]